MVSVVLKVTFSLVLACVVLMEGARAIGEMLPQGDEVAFAGYEQVEHPDAVNVYRYDISRRLSVNLTHEAQGHYFQPAWSPDGSQLAFVAADAPTYALYVVNADGSGLRSLLRHEGRLAYPEWSQDGTRIAYLVETGSGYAANVLNLTPGSAQRFSNVRTPATAQSIALTSQGNYNRFVTFDTDPVESMNEGFPSYSQDALHGDVAYAAFSTRSYIFNFNPAETQQTLANPAAFDDDLLTNPIWAQDGSASTFTVERPNQAPQLYVANGDGTTLSNFPTILGQGSLYPQWAADGSAILYVDAYRSTESIFSMNVEPNRAEQSALRHVMAKAFAVRPRP